MAVTSSGRRHNYLELQNPVGENVADGDGEYETDYETFAKHWASVDGYADPEEKHTELVLVCQESRK